MQVDYENYDSLFVTVKLNKLDEIEKYYSALGWECVDSRDDKIYGDIIHLTLRRPHFIAQKDKLQLLQVYMEAALNDVGRLEANPRPKTLFVASICTLLLIAITVPGILLVLLAEKAALHTAGIVFLAAAGVQLVIGLTLFIKTFKGEGKTARLRLESARAEIAEVYNQASLITGMNAVEKITGGLSANNALFEVAASDTADDNLPAENTESGLVAENYSEAADE